jgi:type IV pilus assembly protein PilC
MPTYVVTGRSTSGKPLRQKVEAPSPSEARTLMAQQGMHIQDIKQSRGASLPSMADIQTSMAKVTVKDKAVFSRQFAALVSSGVALVRGISILADQCPNPKMKQALMGINADVQQGTNLSDSMKKYPKCFDNLYVSMVQAGEVGGVLDEVLNRLAKLLEDLNRLQNQIKSAMAYPVTVGFLATTIFLGMTIFLLPIFADIFEDLGAPLPLFTRALMAISKMLRTWYLMGGLIITISVLVFAYKQYYKTPIGRVTMDGFFLKMPLFGDLAQKSATARFCRTFGSLSRSGVPILTALEIVRDTSGNQVIANAINSAQVQIQSGGMISLALQEHGVFPVMAIQMINIGEETGELDQMLMKVADFYEDEVEQAVKALTSIMEPIMIVVLGGMVGSILVAMYLPMFSVMDHLG